MASSLVVIVLGVKLWMDELMKLSILLHAMSSRRSQNKSARHQRAAAMSSSISKQSFICQLFRVSQAKHSLCSKQNILCVRSTTRLVFETENSLCRKQNIPCVRSRTFLVFQTGHLLRSKQDIMCGPSRRRCFSSKNRFSSKHIDPTP